MVKCSNCNEVYHENATQCPNCGTEKSASKSVHTATTERTTILSSVTGVANDMSIKTSSFGTVEEEISYEYAPYGVRVVAWLIDTVVITVGTAILNAIVGEFGTILAFIATACYFGYFESSQYMGTPGKILMQLKVIDTTGDKISFLRGVGRYVAKIPSALILGIGYLFPLFTQKKQALHDIIASCIVVKR